MKFIYRGVFSKGLNTQEAMGVTFTGRNPADVREQPSINWMLAHPEYEAQAEPVVEVVRHVKPPRAEIKKAKKVKK